MVAAAQHSWNGIHLDKVNTVSVNFKTPPSLYANHVIWGMQSVTDEIIRQDMDSIRRKGFKSVIIEPGYHMPAEYLSDGYFKMVRKVVAEAKKNGLKVWIIDEGKYPSGFAGGKFSRERPELRMQALVTCGKIDVKAGDTLVARKIDDYVISAVAVSMSGRPNKDVTIDNHTISFTAGMDDWQIILVRSDYRTGQTRSVDSPTGAKDTRNSQMDYLNSKAVRQFIDWTHEQYKKYVGKEFGKTIMGFRGDEPDYSHVPFTPEIISVFKNIKGYDVTPYFASFFAPAMTAVERQAKADYWDVWAGLFADNFFRQESEWCEANGMAYITHLNNDHDMPVCVKNEGDLFRTLSKTTIPGVDAIWNQIWPDTINDFPKYASSVAHVYGKPRAFSESFAAYYSSPTIPEAKFVVDHQMARGINFFEYMFWLSGSEKPNWMADPKMEHLNIYSNRMVYLLSQGRPGARIAVYYPTATLQLGNTGIAERVKRISHQLLEHQCDFDYVGEYAFKEALKVCNGYLENKSGQQYTTLLIPSADILPACVDSVIRAFSKRGGKVLFWGSMPYSVYGKSFRQQTTFSPTENSWQEYTDSWTPAVEASLGRREIIIKNKKPLEKRERKKAGERRPKPIDGTIDIRYNHRVLPDADLFFIFNEGHREQSFTAGMDCIGNIEVWNAEDGSITPAKSRIEEGRTWIDIELKEWETITLVVRRQDKTYNIEDEGAKGDGTTVNTRHIQQAIDDAYHNGGGTVFVPKGIFLTGSLFFRPGVNLRVDKGGTLMSSVCHDDFPVIATRFEGKEVKWKPALVNFIDCPGARLEGDGTIDGRGVEWKTIVGNDFFAVYGRPRLVCFTRSNGAVVRGIHLKDQASWGLHILYTDSMLVEDVDIKADHTIPSSDGIDIDSSSRIIIRNCRIEDNDDCISIKAGKDEEGRSIGIPTEDVLVENCVFGYGHSGVDFGSEVSGDIRRVIVQNCKMEKGNSGAVRIKSQPSRGGIVEDIIFRNIILDGSDSFLDINMNWRMKPPLAEPAPVKTQLRNILIENVSGQCRNMGRIFGDKDYPINGITFRNCKIKYEKPLETRFCVSPEKAGL